jgi:hypothetical protein
LVARFVRVEEVGGSNPLSPTIQCGRAQVDWARPISGASHFSHPHLPSNRSTPLSDRGWLDLVGPALLVLIAALFLIPPLWTPGLVNPGDFIMSVHRIYELDAALQAGVYYPRLGPSFNFGYGAPLFQYYPPLASYLGLLFVWAGLGYIAAAKALLSVSLVVAGIGAYVYGRFLFRSRLAATVAGFLNMASPYLLLVVFERGAVAELLAWGLLPWLFWAAHATYAAPGAHGQRRYGIAFAALVALYFLAHNATAMFVVPGVLLFLVLLALLERRRRALLPVALAFVLGASMSAFYWVPAVAEMGFSKAEEFMFNEATDVTNNVVAPAEVMQHSIVPQYVGPERFRIALWQFAVGALGVFGLALQRRRPRALWLLAGAFLAILLLQTTWSLPFWTHVPMVRFIQFPWRLHGVASFAVAMLGGALLMTASLASPVRRAAWLGAPALLVGVLVWLGTINMGPEKSLIWMHGWDEADINQAAMWERGLSGYPLWTDYTLVTLPIGSTGYTRPRPAGDASRLPPTTTPQIVVVGDNPMQTLLDVDAAEPWTLRLHRAWLPGWQVRANGVHVATYAGGGGGLVSAEMPAGQYRVEARLDDSPVRRVAAAVSLLALAIWIVLLVRPRRDWISLVLFGVVAVALALGVRLVTVEAKPMLRAEPFRAPLDIGVTMLAHNLPTTDLCIGDAVPLRTWWHVGRTPDADFKFFVHIVTPDDTAKVAQFDTFPFDGYVPMTRWEAGELVPHVQTLALDETIPPGIYQLILGLYDPLVMENARVLDAPAVLPGDRLRLAELTISDCSP